MKYCVRLVNIMSEIEDNTGNSYEKLVTELRTDLENLGSPLSRECCIYRVPSNLRRVNEAAYTPHIVSIGPLHYGDENLKKMEKHKLRYLKIFLKRAERRAKSLEDFVGYVKVNEERVRLCYAETFEHLNSDEFARMILVDASFIIEHILRLFHGILVNKDKEDRQLIFDIPFLQNTLFWKDLALLENQLPFFVLEGLFGMVFEDRPFSDISHIYFTAFNYQGKPKPKDFKHFTDLIRYYQLPEGKEEKEQTKTPTVHNQGSWFSDCSSRLSKALRRALQPLLRLGFHVLSLLICQKPREAKQIDDKGNADYLYSATELHEAGVRFQVSSSKCPLDLKFTDKRVLEMPCFTVVDHTEASIRNVMAFEQCHYPDERRVCDYFILMDYLINTEKDVDLLVQNKILVNRLGSNQEVASLVNKLGLEMIYSGEKSRHSETIRKLNKYYEAPHHKWIAALRHVYFKTPWRSASTIAAIILLLLTLAQTICSFLSL